MSILINRQSRFLIQGITGNMGRFSLRDMVAYGTQVVAGISTSFDQQYLESVPVFRNIAQARRETDVNVSIVYAPAIIAKQQVLEAFDAGIQFVIYPGDGLPVNDAIALRAAAKSAGATLLGPNTAGIITPGQAKAGFMPSFAYQPGRVGVISRSGSLSYEACHRLTLANIGQSTVVGIGGDPVKGLKANEALALFHEDADTDVVLYLGEIGGDDEYAVALYAQRVDAKPVAALIVGRTAPLGKKMGHAAAMIGGYSDGHEAKINALLAAKVQATGKLSEVVTVTQAAIELNKHKLRKNH
jgi:succinyl-CoA synthetase alpha subunit